MEQAAEFLAVSFTDDHDHRIGLVADLGASSRPFGLALEGIPFSASGQGQRQNKAETQNLGILPPRISFHLFLKIGTRTRAGE